MAYEDLNTSYLDSVSETDPTVANVTAVKKGLERLLNTPKGHNPFNREYGSSLYDLLFENSVSASDIQMFLYMDITSWEPRLNLSPNDIHIAQIDEHTFKVTCMFSLNGYNTGISTLISRE